MKRFAIVFSHNGRNKVKGFRPFNFYAQNESQVRHHFDKLGYGIESIRLCSTLTD